MPGGVAARRAFRDALPVPPHQRGHRLQLRRERVGQQEPYGERVRAVVAGVALQQFEVLGVRLCRAGRTLVVVRDPGGGQSAERVVLAVQRDEVVEQLAGGIGPGVARVLAETGEGRTGRPRRYGGGYGRVRYRAVRRARGYEVHRGVSGRESLRSLRSLRSLGVEARRSRQSVQRGVSEASPPPAEGHGLEQDAHGASSPPVRSARCR